MKSIKDRLEAERARLTEGIEMMRSGILTTGDVDRAGRLTDRTSETIDLYKQIIERIDEALGTIKQQAR